MKKAFLIISSFYALPVWAQLNVPLTVQEALYPGDPTGTVYGSTAPEYPSTGGGTNRSSEPFCMGVPLADSAGITNPQALSLSGATAGQFRTLGTWPDGHLKWVEVCGVLASLNAGSTATVTLQNGSGNFPAGNMASSNGSTITVNTTGGTCGQPGVTCFTVKAAGNFNVVDTVTIGTTTVVGSSSAATRGLVLMGPNPTATYPASVTCGTGAGQSACTTLYSSANDPGSSCTIEENGPVMTALRCIGTHYDNANHPYMHFTARMYFYRGKNYVKVTSAVRNADFNGAVDSGGNTFDSAFKGFQSYELRVTPNILGTLNYTIAADPTSCTSGVCTGTMSGSDNAFIYQGLSSLMQYAADCGLSCGNTITTDNGYVIKKNGAVVASNVENLDYTGAVTPTSFYADVADNNGVGVEIGVYQAAAYWDKSLEFQNGGSDVRIGIRSAQNSQPVYQAWPAWDIEPAVFLNFHASNPTSLSAEFLKFQHYLVLRASRQYYNSTSVFPYPMPDVSHEDAFYNSTWASASYADGTTPLAGTACCTLDIGTQNYFSWNIAAPHYKNWPNSGPANQEEFRWSNMLRFLRTGQTGRWLDSAQFYRMEAGNSWPHADGTSATDSTPNDFQWRTQSGNLDTFGRPLLNRGCFPGDGYSSCPNITNAPLAFVDYHDALHFHWWGILDYYFLTGDEMVHEGIIPEKDWYMNSNTFQGGATIEGQYGIGVIRGIGIEILSASKFGDFLAATGDPDAATVLAQGTTNFNLFVKPQGCMNSYPAGCTMPPAQPISGTYAGNDPPGVSRLRGAPASTVGRGSGRCGASPTSDYRGIASFYGSLLIEGLLSLSQSNGTSWSDYNTARDLAYGISQWSFAEQYYDDGGSYFYKGGGISPTLANDTFYNGFTYSDTFDVPYQCPAGTAVVAGVTSQYSAGGPVFDLLQGTVYPMQGMFMTFYVQQLINGSLTASQQRQLKIAMDWIRGAQGQSASDFGQYQIASVFEGLDEPSGITLQDVPFTVTSLGGGQYSLSWTVPNGIQSAMAPSPYRIKWSPQIIAPSVAGTYSTYGKVDGMLNYDAVLTGTFGLSPNTYATWFGANGTTEPATLASGQTQTFTVNAGVSGLTAANFSVKAYATTQAVGPATHLSVTGYPTPTTAGASHTVTVVALDASNNVVTGYAGTVHFTSSDPAAVLPANYTFQTGDGGSHTFGVTLNTVAAAQSITVTDVASSSINGGQTGIQVTSATGTGAADLTYVSGNNQQGSITSSSITWVNTSPTGSLPVGMGYTNMVYDPVSQQTYLPSNPNPSGSIYTGNMYTYNSSNHVFTNLGGLNETTGGICTLDTATMPGERHYGHQFFMDFVGQRLVMFSGVNQNCNGNPAGPNANPRQDMYFMYLHGTPSLDWHQAIPPGFPSVYFNDSAIGAAAQDTTHNVYLFFSGNLAHNLWLYCPTYANPTQGTLTAAQTSVGCTAASTDNWVEVTNMTCAGADCVAGGYGPPGAGFGDMVYVASINRFFQGFGANGPNNTAYTHVFSGVLAASSGAPMMAWTEVGLTGEPTNDYPDGPGGNINQPAWAVTPNGIYYHSNGQFDTAGNSLGTPPSDWLLNVNTGTWSKVGNLGGPSASNGALMTYDSSQNKLIVQEAIAGSPATMWEGSLGSAGQGQQLSSPFVVAVTDGSGNPVPNSPVTFAVTSGGGTLNGGVTTMVVNTNSTGQAFATLTVGSSPGSNTVTATAGTLAGSPVTFTAMGVSGSSGSNNPCDLNGDGVVNQLDVNLAISQVLGPASCTSANLEGNGRCDVIDVQRIIYASMGGACLVGQ